MLQPRIEPVHTKVMPARYAGTCRICKGYIRPGDMIEWSKETAAIHADAEVCRLVKEAQKAPAETAPIDPSQLEAGYMKRRKAKSIACKSRAKPATATRNG